MRMPQASRVWKIIPPGTTGYTTVQQENATTHPGYATAQPGNNTVAIEPFGGRKEIIVMEDLPLIPLRTLAKQNQIKLPYEIKDKKDRVMETIQKSGKKLFLTRKFNGQEKLVEVRPGKAFNSIPVGDFTDLGMGDIGDKVTVDLNSNDAAEWEALDRIFAYEMKYKCTKFPEIFYKEEVRNVEKFVEEHSKFYNDFWIKMRKDALDNTKDLKYNSSLYLLVDAEVVRYFRDWYFEKKMKMGTIVQLFGTRVPSRCSGTSIKPSRDALNIHP